MPQPRFILTFCCVGGCCRRRYTRVVFRSYLRFISQVFKITFVYQFALFFVRIRSHSFRKKNIGVMWWGFANLFSPSASSDQPPDTVIRIDEYLPFPALGADPRSFLVVALSSGRQVIIRRSVDSTDDVVNLETNSENTSTEKNLKGVNDTITKAESNSSDSVPKGVCDKGSCYAIPDGKVVQRRIFSLQSLRGIRVSRKDIDLHNKSLEIDGVVDLCGRRKENVFVYDVPVTKVEEHCRRASLGMLGWILGLRHSVVAIYVDGQTVPFLLDKNADTGVCLRKKAWWERFIERPRVDRGAGSERLPYSFLCAGDQASDANENKNVSSFA